MREIINYMIEANVALLLFLAAYRILLRRETSFRLMRFFMLAAIFVSLSFPLIQLNNDQYTALPSMSNVVPANWLPEIVISVNREQQTAESTNTAYNLWQVAGWVYGAGALFFLAWLILQLVNVLKTLRNAASYRLETFKVIESKEDKPTFSFFHLIYIGRAHELSGFEKQQIIRHEAVHASQLHSLDILIVTLLKVVFWFNPFINSYKRIFIQLHEFEADARAVENSDVNKYCSLLARVALQSVHFPIASHFNHSLTLKRIEMMRTVKTTIKRWKLVALVTMVPIVFFFISCQDQVSEEIREITKNSSHALTAPEHVQKRFEQLKNDNPGKKYVLLELNETASQKLQALKEDYGLPKSVEVFKTGDKTSEKTGAPTVSGTASDIMIDTGTPKNGEQTFAIIEFNEQTRGLSEASKTGTVFVVVEQQPEYVGGYDAMKDFIRENMRYPKAAAKAGIEGTVYISFVVNKDGSLSDFEIKEGVEPSLDAEALRVMKLLPAWKPGRQNGKPVRVRFIIPVKFNPDLGSNPVPASGISQINTKMKISTRTAYLEDKIIVEGTVRSAEDQKALPGVNIVVPGTTTGVSTDINGNFKIALPKDKKQLAFSFIGFETSTIDF